MIFPFGGLKIKPEPPVINTQWGPVTESARHQAALNMKYDPIVRTRVEEKVISECGGDVARGMAEMKKRYPETYA